MAHRYLFLLGREPELSAAEIAAVFSLWNIAADTAGRPPYLIAATASPISPERLMARLGGTIKIGEAIDGDGGGVEARIADFLDMAQAGKKIEFSLSGDAGRPQALAVKKILKARDRSVRYIEPKNTATILHNKLVEHRGDITVAGQDIFVTRAIQPIEELSRRDYGRPGSDARSGMLPPKLAKILVNLALVPEDAMILDPFCGSGTILTEAMVMGYRRLIGSDLSPKAADDTKKNIQWTDPEADIPVFVLDAQDLSKKIPNHSVDAIITETYLGRPLYGTEPKTFLSVQANELKRLYIRTLAAFTAVLKPGGIVVIALPAFRSGKEWIHIDIAPDAKKMGFTQTSLLPEKPSLLYARPDQFVGREIYRFSHQ
jgi:tRNA G10  N-methylase Trm11